MRSCAIVSNDMRQERHASAQKKYNAFVTHMSQVSTVMIFISSRLLPRKERFIKRAELFNEEWGEKHFCRKWPEGKLAYIPRECCCDKII